MSSRSAESPTPIREPLRRCRTRPWAAAFAIAVGLTVTACANSSNTAPPPTFGVDSPWLGMFTAVGLPAPVNSLSALDCVNATRCWAVGSTVGSGGAPNGAAVIATTDGGVRWAPQVIPPTVGYLSAVGCNNGGHCTAVGQAGQAAGGDAVIVTTADGGAHWTQVPAPAGILDLTAVSCHPDGWCLAVGSSATGSVALVSATSGASWVQTGALPPSLSGASAISCTGDQRCWVTGHDTVALDHVAGALALTTDGGANWATVATPTGIGSLNGISCISGSPTGSGALPVPSTTTTTPPPTTGTTAAVPSGSSAATTSSADAPTTTTTTTAPPPTSTTTTAPIVGIPGVRCTVVGTTADSPGLGQSRARPHLHDGQRWGDLVEPDGHRGLRLPQRCLVHRHRNLCDGGQLGHHLDPGRPGDRDRFPPPSVEGGLDGGRTPTPHRGELHLRLPVHRRR